MKRGVMRQSVLLESKHVSILRRLRGGFQNDAAEKIWNDHIGNNAFVRHRDQCPICQEAIEKTRDTTFVEYLAGQRPEWCAEGVRIFDQMLDEVLEKVDEALSTGN